jgi:hypothetical protein
MQIVEFVTRILDSRGADEKVLSNVPLFIQRSIIKLQRKDLFPALTVRYTAKEKVETEYRNDGSELYKYITLPDDFRELDRLEVDNKKYIWFNNEYDIERESARRNIPLFTIKQVLSKTEDFSTRLILQPFPAGDEEISVDYHIDGSEKCLGKITQEYWESILNNIEADLGLRSPESADSELADIVNQNKHMEGFGSANGRIKKLRPSYFASK